MFRSFLLACILALIIPVASNAQLGKIPAAVTDSFSKQYPHASGVSYSDNLGDYSVRFKMDTVQMLARYNKKGQWRGSEKTVSFESLSVDVKDGFMKSKFSDWQVKDVLQLYLTPDDGGGEQFRIKVSKGDLKRRYLYFNSRGKLVKDKMTF
jgi:hypothetical protein